jgi:predicted RNase H-like HicB family nuclease
MNLNPAGFSRFSVSNPWEEVTHTQGETLDELQANLKEVLELILEDGVPVLQSEFVGIQQVVVA